MSIKPVRVQAHVHGKSLGKRIWQHRVIYLFILPAVVWFLIFNYYPMYGLLLAFKNYKYNLGILGSPWVGVKWFRKFLLDRSFWQIIRNTLSISVLKLVFGFPMPIILALMLDSLRNQKFKRVIQTISYMPHFISWVVVSAMLTKLLSPYGGLVNEVRKMLDPNAQSIFYMGQRSFFLPMVILSDIWKGVGWGSIIYLAALSGIDPTLYEAAAIDGARRGQMIRHITLPCLVPTAIILLIMNLGGILNVGYEQMLLLSTTPTQDIAEVIDTYVLRKGLSSGGQSYATAIGMTKSVISLLLVATVNQIAKTVSDVSLW